MKPSNVWWFLLVCAVVAQGGRLLLGYALIDQASLGAWTLAVMGTAGFASAVVVTGTMGYLVVWRRRQDKRGRAAALSAHSRTCPNWPRGDA